MKTLLTILVCALTLAMNASLQAADGPYRHVVLFKFKDSATKEQIKAVETAFLALPSKINTIQSLEWGTNVSSEKHDEGFTHCYFLTFNDKSGVEVYIPHPEHKAFGAMLHPILDKVIVIDYVAQK